MVLACIYAPANGARVCWRSGGCVVTERVTEGLTPWHKRPLGGSRTSRTAARRQQDDHELRQGPN